MFGKYPIDPCIGCSAEFAGLGNTCGDPCDRKREYEKKTTKYYQKPKG